jgi:hypothetical protein
MLLGFIIAMAVQTHESDLIMKRRRPTKEQRRVVVTGMGAVTSIDHDVDVFYTNLPDGVSGISRIECFHCAEFLTVCFLWLKNYCKKWLYQLYYSQSQY